jgi:hypothetical protein
MKSTILKIALFLLGVGALRGKPTGTSLALDTLGHMS